MELPPRDLGLEVDLDPLDPGLDEGRGTSCFGRLDDPCSQDGRCSVLWNVIRSSLSAGNLFSGSSSIFLEVGTARLWLGVREMIQNTE